MTRAEIRERAKAEREERTAAEKSGEKPKAADPVEVALTVFPVMISSVGTRCRR